MCKACAHVARNCIHQWRNTVFLSTGPKFDEHDVYIYIYVYLDVYVCQYVYMHTPYVNVSVTPIIRNPHERCSKTLHLKEVFWRKYCFNMFFLGRGEGSWKGRGCQPGLEHCSHVPHILSRPCVLAAATLFWDAQEAARRAMGHDWRLPVQKKNRKPARKNM